MSAPEKQDKAQVEGLQLYSLEAGGITVGPDFFYHYNTSARTCLTMVKDASILLSKLLEDGHSLIAGRLVGAFWNIGNARIADNILTMVNIWSILFVYSN